MRLYWKSVLLLFVTVLLLSACGDDEEVDIEEPVETNEDTTADTEEEESTESASSDDDTYEDQLDVQMGEVGTFETLIGVFEVTVHRAELLDNAYDDQAGELDDLLKIEMTVKNISEETYSVEDFLDTLEINDRKEGSGFPLYGTNLFPSLEDISGDLEPGEEKTGERITEVYENDTYYLKRTGGNQAAAGTNEVIITMPADEAK